MDDYILRATAADGLIRAFAATTKNTVQTARSLHNTTPVASAALGRLLTAGAMMGTMLKGEKDLVTLQIKGDGPIEGLLVTADSKGRVKGYPFNPNVDIPPKSPVKLDVGGAVGKGYLTVIKDLGLKEPYVGKTELVSGEIAEDLTYYYAKSEQIPTSVALGVLVDTDNSVIAAGGFMIQLMPEATEEMAVQLEDILKELPPVTTMIKEGMTAEDILFRVTEGFSMVCENKAVVPEYKCTCSKERMEKALISIGKKELEELIEDQGEAELTCQFCDNKYHFNKKELEDLLEKAK
ncbi:MAG TPA: Hsp33 family molecular chaperone HslO [Paraprevotella xylaniphila]|nr:Hsp33 family molecular chaperone HslO [Paraprevotella xylaniphila]